MNTQYYTATSLDGFIATEDDSLEWLFPLGDVNETSYPEFIRGVGALAMGSATYEWMLRHAQTVSTETGSAWPYEQPTWVFSSRTLPVVPGALLHFVQGDVRPVHAQMLAAASDSNIWVVGGGDLAGQFHDAGEWQTAFPASAPEPIARTGFRQADGKRVCRVALSRAAQQLTRRTCRAGCLQAPAMLRWRFATLVPPHCADLTSPGTRVPDNSLARWRGACPATPWRQARRKPDSAQ